MTVSGFTVVPNTVRVVTVTEAPKGTPVFDGDTVTVDGRVWNLAAGTRTNVDGSVVAEQHWSTAEKTVVESWRDHVSERNHKAAIAAGIDDVELLRTNAQTDITVADAAWEQTQTAVTAWTNRAATIRAATPTLALLQEEAAKAAERDAVLMGAVAEVLVWRVKANTAIIVACRSLLGVGRIMVRQLR